MCYIFYTRSNVCRVCTEQAALPTDPEHWRRRSRQLPVWLDRQQSESAGLPETRPRAVAISTHSIRLQGEGVVRVGVAAIHRKLLKILRRTQLRALVDTVKGVEPSVGGVWLLDARHTVVGTLCHAAMPRKLYRTVLYIMLLPFTLWAIF